MGVNLQREYLPDTTDQRFQENVARQNSKIQENQNSTNASNENRFIAIEGVTIEFNITANTITTIGHSLNGIPTAWTIIDLVSISGVAAPCTLMRTSLGVSTVAFYNSGTGGDVYKYKVRLS